MRRLALAVDTAIQRLSVASLAVAAVFIGLIALIGAADVIGTSLLAKPVPSALELSEAGLAIVVFMGLAQAQRRRQHITVDIISAGFRGKLQGLSVGLALLAAIAFFGFVAWRGGLAAWQSVLIDERSMGQSSFPIWPCKILLFVGCVAAVLEASRQFIHLLAGDPGVEESER